MSSGGEGGDGEWGGCKGGSVEGDDDVDGGPKAPADVSVAAALSVSYDLTLQSARDPFEGLGADLYNYRGPYRDICEAKTAAQAEGGAGGKTATEAAAMARGNLEAGFDVAAKALSAADYILVCAGAGLGVDAGMVQKCCSDSTCTHSSLEREGCLFYALSPALPLSLPFHSDHQGLARTVTLRCSLRGKRPTSHTATSVPRRC